MRPAFLLDKVDLFSALAYLIVMAAFLASFPVVRPGLRLIDALSSPGIALQVFGLPTLFIFGYPAYWAFGIRRALAVRIYRNQALGIGLICVAFALGFLANTAIGYVLFLLVVFYWIDASFFAGRRSDPLLRKTLHWNRLRVVFWASNLFTAVPLTSYSVLTGDYGHNTAPDGALGLIATAVPGFLTATSGIVLGLVVSRRSRDVALRGHLAWFGVFVFTQFTIVSIAAINNLGGLVFFIGIVLNGFFLYKSARSLAPLNRLSPT